MDCVRDSSTSPSYETKTKSTATPSAATALCFSEVSPSDLWIRARREEGGTRRHRRMGLCISKPEGRARGRLVSSGKRNRRRRRRSIKRRPSSQRLDSSSAPNRPHSTPTCAGFYMHFPFSLLFNFLVFISFSFFLFLNRGFFLWLAIGFGACSSAACQILAALCDD